MVPLARLFRHFPQCPATPTAGTAVPLDLAALMGAAAWSRLPPAVQRRFAAGHADTAYTGEMELRCSAVGHLFAALASLIGGPLTHLNARALPTRVQVRSNGQGGVVWERSIRSDSGERLVCSTKELDPEGRLRERTAGGLSMSLEVFEERGALVFLSRRFWLVRGRLRLPVPALLTPGACRVSHEDLGEGRFRFTLRMVHPWWGETFHQSGVFTDPLPNANTHESAP